MPARRTLVTALAAALALAAGTAAAPAARARPPMPCFRTPVTGLFVQENASAALAAPGQHPSFGATAPWPAIRAAASAGVDRRLFFFIRHGQADSNVVQAAVGQVAWDGGVGQKCGYKGVRLFDAALTRAGAAQASALGTTLAGPRGLAMMLGSPSPFPPPAVVASPLARALATAALALGPSLPPTALHVSDLARERVGVNTCDARRPAADGGASPCGAQPAGLRSLFGGGAFDGFPVVGRGRRRLGLVSDTDEAWTREARESDASLDARAAALLEATWADTPPGTPIVIVAHSGFVPAALAAAGRAPYPPQNAEVVPALIERCSGGA